MSKGLLPFSCFGLLVATIFSERFDLVEVVLFSTACLICALRGIGSLLVEELKQRGEEEKETA